MKNLGILIVIFFAHCNIMFAVEVINAGIGGNTSSALLNRVHQDVISKKPALVVIMAGTNDALNSKKLCSFEKYRSNLEKLVEAISGHGAKIILMTIPPFYEKYLLKRHKIAAFKNISPQTRVNGINKIIKEVGSKHQIEIVDINKLFQAKGGANEKRSSLLRNVNNSKAVDGVHPTVEGYKLIADAVAECVKKNKLPTNLIICFGDSITYGIGAKRGINSYPDILKKLLKDSSNRQ